MTSDQELRQLQETKQMQQVQQKYVNPPHFSWPTSKPGPEQMLPPPGQKPVPGRTEQMVEIGYNQETGEPGTSDPRKWFPDASIHGETAFDQLETAQEVMKKRTKK